MVNAISLLCLDSRFRVLRIKLSEMCKEAGNWTHEANECRLHVARRWKCFCLGCNPSSFSPRQPVSV